jgi:hypothetical protein
MASKVVKRRTPEGVPAEARPKRLEAAHATRSERPGLRSGRAHEATIEYPAEAIIVKEAFEVFKVESAGDITDDGAVDDPGSDTSTVYMDDSNVDKMLEKSVKKSTLAKYGRAWDKWSIFATYHRVDVVPPDIRALEIFVANTAELSGSAGVASMSPAAITHFSSFEGVQSPFTKKPFSRLHITTFMDWARGGSLLDWRTPLPMALCYQQLLTGAEAFDLNGSNVDRRGDHFWVEVETSKNQPEGFSFKFRSTRIGLTTLELSSATTWSRWGLSLVIPSLILPARLRQSRTY